MMRDRFIFMKLVLLFPLLLVSSLHADDITLTDGTVFKNAKIVSHDESKNTSSITFAGGAALVHTEMIIPPGFVATAPAQSSPPPVQQSDPTPAVAVSPQIREMVDKGVWNTTGRILQVNPDGLIVQLAAVYSHEVIVPHSEKKTVDLVPEGLGHTPVYQTEDRQWSTTETKVERINLGVVFVAAPTDELVDGESWTGQVWRIGTYSYTGAGGIRRTVAKYTVRPADAYQYFVAHPGEIPSTLQEPAARAPTAGDNAARTSETLTTPGMNQ